MIFNKYGANSAICKGWLLLRKDSDNITISAPYLLSTFLYYIVPCVLVHNSNYIAYLPDGFYILSFHVITALTYFYQHFMFLLHTPNLLHKTSIFIYGSASSTSDVEVMGLNADECRQAVEKSKCGDMNSFEKLIQFYYPILHRYVACRMGDASEVDDVLQEILLLAWLNIKKLRNTSAFKVWLMRIANNCCNKWYRSKSQLGVPAVDDALTSLIDRRHSMSEETEENERLLLALDKLPESQKQTIIDFYFKSLKITEIAFLHNMPVGTVKRILHDGRLNLKKRLEEMNYE